VTDLSEIDESNAKVQFGLVGVKKFRIDQESDWVMALPQSFEENGQLRLARWDRPEDEIEIYDYYSEDLLHSISFDHDGGPNSITGLLNAFQIINKDTVFVMDDSNYLILTNYAGEIKAKYPLPSEEGAPWIKASTVPMSLKKGIATLINYPIINPDKTLMIDLNLKDSTITDRYKIPYEYIDGYWAIGDFSWFSLVDMGDSRVFSYPNLDSLYIYGNDDTSITKVYAGSKAFNYPTERLVEYGVAPPADILPILHFTRPIYRRLLYDKYRKVYYRIIGKPISKTLLDSNDPIRSRTREFFVLVLNEKFEWLGEFDLPSYQYQINGDFIFINKEGIHLQRESENEDEAIFDIYSVIDNS
jgi:hypothetical protein